MKKIYFLLFFGMFMVNIGFSQRNFTENYIQKSTMELTGRKTNILNNMFADSKVYKSTEENEKLIRSKNSIRRGGTSEGGFFFLAGLGYGFSLNSQNIIDYSEIISTTTSTTIPPLTVAKQIDLSLGKGLNFKLAAGYMISRNLGFELGISYLMGDKTISSSTAHTYLNDTLIDIAFNQTGKALTEITYKASMLRINPSIVIVSGMEGISPYAKFGISLGFCSYYREEFKNNSDRYSSQKVGIPILLTDTTFITQSFKREEYSGGISIGFNASAGCNFTINDNLSVFAEFNMLNMSYSPDKSEITEYKVQGVNTLPNLTVMQRQTNYYETITSSNTVIPDTVPGKALKQSFSFGSFGLSIGVKFNF